MTDRNLQPVIRSAVAAFVALAAATAGAVDWYVVCDESTNLVKLVEAADRGGSRVLQGPFPGARTAGMWVQENAPDGRCPGIPAGEFGRSLETGRHVVSWIAVCAPSTGTIEVVQGDPPAGWVALTASGGGRPTHPDRATADTWARTVCPTWRCDALGRCATGSAYVTPPPPRGRWIASPLVSTRLGDAAAGGTHPVGRSPSQPTTALAPRAANLDPLIKTATNAVKNCSYRAALAAADHMTNFDDNHPWLVANHGTLRELAFRQRATESMAVKAGSALKNGDLKQARELAERAADSAVGCQTLLVSQLLQGIDAAIVQDKARRNAANRRAAAAMLPGLINLANVISGVEAGTVEWTPETASSVATSFMPGGTSVDLCAFQLQYSDPNSVVPTCTCAGYRYDAASFRCVR
jgi:hypothetical protein